MFATSSVIRGVEFRGHDLKLKSNRLRNCFNMEGFDGGLIAGILYNRYI